MAEHDPLRFVADLSASLASRSRHVSAFLGAGVARACGLPDISTLETVVTNKLPKKQREAFARQLDGRNLEEALSRLRRIAALLEDEQKIDELTADEAKALDAAVCQQIVKALDVADADLAPAKGLAAWVARADYHLPVELFTVNYDLLIETALDGLAVPYFDGFVGTLRARFHTDLVEALPGKEDESVPRFFARLWKLHGSVNWAWQERDIVRLGHPVSETLAAAIYPSDAKYEESRRVPFIVLQDRFRRALHQPETLMLIAGYSFRDEHLNEMIFEAASRRERSQFVALCYSDIPEVLADRSRHLPNLQVAARSDAILAGVRLGWKAPDETPDDIWNDDGFALGDFRHLGAYLARTSRSDSDMAGFKQTTSHISETANNPSDGT